MSYYEVTGQQAAAPDPHGVDGVSSRIEAALAGARSRLRRLEPAEMPAALARGAILVDIRPAAQRAFEGPCPGALVIERNVLEWRCDPTSEARLAPGGR